MRRQDEAGRGMRWMGQLLGLITLTVFSAFLFLSPVVAQETPEMTPEGTAQETPVATPQEGGGPLIRLEVDAPEEPVAKGEEIEVTVLVDDVEHLASFAFAIQYDPDRLKPVEQELPENGTPRATPVEGSESDGDSIVAVRDVGAFLATSERADGMICFDPKVSERGKVLVSCVTAGLPLCLGGLPGASGSGVLGRVLFKSKGGGIATLDLTDTMLVLDDVVPCDPDPEVGQAQEISHRVEGATIELASVGGIPWAIVGPIIAVVVVLIIGGGVGGFIWSRRGRSDTSP